MAAVRGPSWGPFFLAHQLRSMADFLWLSHFLNLIWTDLLILFKAPPVIHYLQTNWNPRREQSQRKTPQTFYCGKLFELHPEWVKPRSPPQKASRQSYESQKIHFQVLVHTRARSSLTLDLIVKDLILLGLKPKQWEVKTLQPGIRVEA